jgi:hypothetical protein
MKTLFRAVNWPWSLATVGQTRLVLIVVGIGLNVTQQDFYRNEHSPLMRQFTIAGMSAEAVEAEPPFLAYYDCQRGQFERVRAELNLNPSATAFFYNPSDYRLISAASYYTRACA